MTDAPPPASDGAGERDEQDQQRHDEPTAPSRTDEDLGATMRLRVPVADEEHDESDSTQDADVEPTSEVDERRADDTEPEPEQAEDESDTSSDRVTKGSADHGGESVPPESAAERKGDGDGSEPDAADAVDGGVDLAATVRVTTLGQPVDGEEPAPDGARAEDHDGSSDVVVESEEGSEGGEVPADSGSEEVRQDAESEVDGEGGGGAGSADLSKTVRVDLVALRGSGGGDSDPGDEPGASDVEVESKNATADDGDENTGDENTGDEKAQREPARAGMRQRDTTSRRLTAESAGATTVVTTIDPAARSRLTEQATEAGRSTAAAASVDELPEPVADLPRPPRELVPPWLLPPPPKRAELRRRIIVGSAGVLVLALVVLFAVRVTRSFPPPRLDLTMSASMVLAGPTPALSWPTTGQAALEIPGVGVVGQAGPASTSQPIASITKVMTAYLILRDHPLRPGQQGPILTVSQQLAATLPERTAEGQSLVALPAGYRISEYNALQALMLPSADNVADLLAGWDAGSTVAFVARMNAMASRLGMTHTSFADASGFDQGSVSSATDLLKLGEAAMSQPVFSQIVAEPTATVPGIGQINNVNQLLGTDGVVGIKTGSTTPAGGCLLFAARYDVNGKPVTLLGVVLGQRGADIIKAGLMASQSLVASAEQALRQITVLPAGSVVGQLHPGYGAPVPVVTTAPLTLGALPGMRVRLTRTGARSRSGDVATLSVAGGPSVALRTAHSVGAPTLFQRLAHAF